MFETLEHLIDYYNHKLLTASITRNAAGLAAVVSFSDACFEG